jgi:hypothetical protein
LALGLDEGDSVIRRRLRQKLGFILEDTAALVDPSDEVLNSYLQEHAEQFRIPAAVTFSQIYLSPDSRSDIPADAKALLKRLHAGEPQQGLGDAIMLDDRYTLLSLDDIKRRFGERFSKELPTLKRGEWLGPIASGYGEHLLLISDLKPDRLPELLEVKEQVKSEWLLARTAELKQEVFLQLLASYEVVMEHYVPPQEAASLGDDTLSGGAAVEQKL